MPGVEYSNSKMPSSLQAQALHCLSTVPLYLSISIYMACRYVLIVKIINDILSMIMGELSIQSTETAFNLLYIVDW